MTHAAISNLAHLKAFFTKKWIWICFAVAVAIALLIGWTTDLAYEEPTSFTPASLDEEYRTNDLMATFAYEDKRISLSGVVAETGEESPAPLTPERPFAVIGEDPAAGSSAQVKCYFSADSEDASASGEALQPGDSVTIEGTLLGNSLMPIMSSCTILAG